MYLSDRNRNVALSRWKKIHARQIARIPNDTNALLLKAAVCGFLAGDGSVQKRKEKRTYHYQIDFFPDDMTMMNTYIKQINSLYNKTPTIRKHNKFYSARFTSKVAVEDLFHLAKFGIKKWTLPKSLFDIEGAKTNWLKAFFSAEAYVSNKSIKIQTINRKGMKDISKILNELGIGNKYYEYKSKIKSESPVSIIIIGNKKNRLKFYEIVGFWHDKKNKLLSESLGL